MTMKFPLAILAGALAFSVALPATAQVKAIGRYKDWRVFTEKVGSDLVCFAAVEASDMAPKNVSHGEVNFIIATWKSGAARDQPSLQVGYNLRTEIPPEATVGRSRYRMYSAGKEAFFTDGDEKPFLAAVKKGTELRVEAASQADARTAYHFSLKGSTDAVAKAKALCK